MAIRAAFLDRDGTINVEREYLHRIVDFEFIPGTIEGLQLLSGAGIEIIVVTNQAGIAKGIFSETDLAAVNQHMLNELERHAVRLGGIYVCPHHPEATVAAYRRACSCRKPNPGLLVEAMRRRGIAPSEAVMIGDKNSDVEAGKALGLTTYLVETGYGATEKRDTEANYVVPDLLSAAIHILRKAGCT